MIGFFRIKTVSYRQDWGDQSAGDYQGGTAVLKAVRINV